MTQRILRVAISGAEGVGKTALCNALAGKEIPPDYNATIGVDFFSLRLNDTTKIIFWDLGGNPRFQQIVNAYVIKSDLLMLVYDTTCHSSVYRLEQLIDNEYHMGKWFERIIIVGNKKDKVVDKTRPESTIIRRDSSVPLAQHLADKLKAPHALVSSKTKSGIDRTIEIVLSLGKDIIPYQELDRPQPGYKLGNRKRDCCAANLPPCTGAREGFCRVL